MIKNIVFDLGGVILKYDQKEIISYFTNKEDEINYIKNDIFGSEEWKLMDLGMITKEEAIQNINIRNNNKYKELTENFLYNWCDKREFNEETVDIAKKLKGRGYNIYVLSNMADETYKHFKNHEFFSICNGIIISAYEHIKKPDDKIFNILLERFSLKAEECLFIDDDYTGRSYKVANAIGINGRKVEVNNSIDVCKLLDECNINLK